MVNQELIGELCAPRELIVPSFASGTGQPQISGALFLSGAKLYIFVGGKGELITSA